MAKAKRDRLIGLAEFSDDELREEHHRRREKKYEAMRPTDAEVEAVETACLAAARAEIGDLSDTAQEDDVSGMAEKIFRGISAAEKTRVAAVQAAKEKYGEDRYGPDVEILLIVASAVCSPDHPARSVEGSKLVAFAKAVAVVEFLSEAKVRTDMIEDNDCDFSMSVDEDMVDLLLRRFAPAGKNDG